MIYSNEPEELISQMERVRRLASSFNKLRDLNKIPLRQPLLDYAFGGLYIFPDFKRVLAEDINILNQGYDFADRNYYMLEELPIGKDWQVLKENGYWVALYTKIPDWLKEIGDNRKREREEILKRKKLENVV